MRGANSYGESLFSTIRLNNFVPAIQPLPSISSWLNDTLGTSDEKLSSMCEAHIRGGRPSIAPETLMRAMRLRVLFSMRNERQMVEQINFNLPFRWFVGLSIDDMVWNYSVFSKSRDRLIIQTGRAPRRVGFSTACWVGYLVVYVFSPHYLLRHLQLFHFDTFSVSR